MSQDDIGRPGVRGGAVSDRLLLDFDAFFLEHRLCGDLDGGATDERAWLACVACGARIERPVETS
jgi:hypothetical protein